VGTATYFAQANDGTCDSLTRTAVTVTINAAPAPPVAGPDIFQCEQSPLQTITATATVPSGETVIWYDAPNAGTVVVPPSINTAISVVYFAEAFDGTCTSLTRTPVILTINALPADPVVGLLTQPDCFTSTGSITIFPVPAGISYSFDSGPFTTTTFYGLLPSGTNHTIVAQNTGGCLSQPVIVSILPQPSTPSAPTVVITQPTCTTPTGAITINGVPGETYSFDGGPFTNVLVYNGLIAASTHTLKSKNASGCISTTTSVTLNIQPLTPAPPTLTPIQPTCTEGTGTVQIANVLGQTYSFDGSPFTTTLNYPGLTGGSTHIVTAQNGSGCISAASTITLDISPPTPNAPAIFAAQPDCTEALGEITILNVAGETYSFDGGPYGPNLIYSDLAAGTYTITATNSFDCISPSTTVTIIPQPITLTPTITDGVLCVDQATGVPFRTHILETGLNLATHSFVWTLDGAVFPETGSSIEVDTPGVYTVVATNISTGCDSQIATATVTESFPGLGIAAQVINQFSDDAGVIVNVNSGTGPFVYQLDNGPPQESNLFLPVSSGSHILHVTDVNGCTDLTSEITVLGYLKFFTPNDDTYNDTWNIIGLEGQPEAIIHIYDRYAKYIKQISANGKGWDGTLNGEPLPSTDYWFTVEYVENGQSKEYKSHFSLVR
jgi:gliding motility-associated-like protein